MICCVTVCHLLLAGCFFLCLCCPFDDFRSHDRADAAYPSELVSETISTVSIRDSKEEKVKLCNGVAYFGVTQKIQHFPQMILQWISLWDRFAVNIDQRAVNVLTTCGKNDDGDDERDELGDAKQIKEGPNDQNNT
ncbi:hypothetical protein C8J56DRAFT_907158 [Mycena floridula]|nr:hypothetical protein C8J56DRAFT_907158 [Mycena floridula]